MQLCSGQFLTQSDLPIQDSQRFDTADVLSIVDQSTEELIIEDPEKCEKEIDAKKDKKGEGANNVKKFFESSDDEHDTVNVKERKKIRKKKKSKTLKLNFSSESESESENKDEEKENISNTEKDKTLEEQEKEVYFDYDSEENEIEVKVSKKELIKNAEKYFENEAELSESEWGSADEDERGLDAYVMELGDEDQFDQGVLQEEVGRIHARKVMDEDIRNIKKIQNLLFEDEENDGVGRERKFRWKNQTEGFSMVDENAQGFENVENMDQDEENETLWRRMRHERETIVNEQSQKMIESETLGEDILLLDQNSQTVTTSNSTTLFKRKFQIIKKSNPSFGSIDSGNKMDSPFLIKNAACKFQSSFLTRDERTLTRIASFMSSKDDDVTNLSSHGGNSMSFAPIEKSDDSKKRKSNDGSTNSESKKRKVESQSFLLEQLT
jgi:hypothetical protein